MNSRVHYMTSIESVMYVVYYSNVLNMKLK